MVGVFFLGTMIDHNAGIDDCSIAWYVANFSMGKKKGGVSAFGDTPVHPCAKWQSSLLFALSRRSLSKGSLINFL
jgi:hypothetical protein